MIFLNYQLIAERRPELSVIEQVLVNRGIAEEDIRHYLNTSDNDIASPELLMNMCNGA